MKKILVVDDEEGVRTAVVMSLKMQGYEVFEAENGMDAFSLAKTHQPDLNISDVMMYSGSGFILREFLKKDDRTSTIPMILMTGYAQGAGAWRSDPTIEYLEKPFSIDELLPLVEQKLNSSPEQ